MRIAPGLAGSAGAGGGVCSATGGAGSRFEHALSANADSRASAMEAVIGFFGMQIPR
jgi:hypothetical protein